MSVIKGYKLPFQKMPSQSRPPCEPGWSPVEQNVIRLAINELVEIGAITLVQSCQGQYVSKIFVILKSDGTPRLILNLKSLNTFLYTTHFKMENYKTVERLIQRETFMSSLDLKNAYHLIPIIEQHRKYLRFCFNGKLYQYNCLPFGLSSAPLVFTKMLKPIVSLLRSRNLMSVVYLDDFLLLGDSYTNCENNVKNTVTLLEKLGFLINYKKSKLVPSTEIKYLGFLFNSLSMTISLPKEKIVKMTALLKKISVRHSTSIRKFAKFLGTLCSNCPAVKYGWVYTKNFERQKFFALQQSNGDFNAQMLLPASLREDFEWWIKHIPTASNSILKDSYRLEVFSDASKTGWGGYCNAEHVYGFWTESEKSYHINYLELKAVFFVTQHFAKDLINSSILCRIDNSTAIAYINKMGSVQHQALNQLSRLIWQWCEQKNIFLFASYIKSKDNVQADKASRMHLAKETEWELMDEAFRDIVEGFGMPDIDLFATSFNTKCKKFVSWLGDPQCVAVDAFTCDWSKFFFYAFPPFSVILRVLRKITEDQARGVVVVPFWPSQPWYPLFSSLLVSKPLFFQPSEKLLSFRELPHPLWEKIFLVAGVLSWRH